MDVPGDLIVKNLVRWDQDGHEQFGVVVHLEANGKQARVRFDDGAEQVFALPSEVIERAELPKGQHVRVLASGEVGVVSAVAHHSGLCIYQVSLPGGTAPSVMEDGLRPAVITDPVQRLRAGQLDTPRATNLRVAATQLLFAYQHDALAALGNSRVEIKPHQVGVVHRVAQTYPHRYILADEVGLGKTIEAGLIMRELLARRVAKRILILAPSGLVGQWQQELKTKFNLSFSLYNGDSVRWLTNEHPSENVWAVRDQVIASTAFASWTPERSREIAGAGWDMVVIDEAHHARRTYDGPGKSTATNLYRLAQEIADPDLSRAQAMLLLTATPMQLHRFELYSLIELLDPALFPTFDDFDTHASELRGLNSVVEQVKRWDALDGGTQASVLDDVEEWLGEDRDVLAARAVEHRGALVEALEAEHRLSRVMVRNRKSVVGGFQPRTAAIWEVDMTPEEHDAYWAVTEYVQTGYARSKATQNNALGFLMATFQKLNASSSHALKGSLIRRIEKLESKSAKDHEAAIIEEAVLEEMPTADALDELLAQRMEAEWEEVKHLERVVKLLEQIPLDSKTRVLLEQLDEIRKQDANAKVLIFTQFRDTQDYIAQHIKRPWNVSLFHGGLKPHDKDASVAAFRDGVGPQVLVSTEAGGEGRNFQYCHIMVNYDLPWNPMRVEQRIGRIDRIGQKHPVLIFNFSTRGTIEERVVEVLTNRIGVFQETIGGLDPILGEVESEFRRIFLLGQEKAEKEFQQLELRVQTRVDEARDAERKLADLIMDTRSYRKEEVEELLERPRGFSSDHVKRFVLSAMQELEVEITRDPEHDGVFRLKFSETFERLFPDYVREGWKRKATFDLSVALDREEVEFYAFGHVVVDGLVEQARKNRLGGITSIRQVFTDEVPPTHGWLFVYALELRGLVERREVVPVFVNEEGGAEPELATWLLERTMSAKREDWPNAPGLPPREDQFEEAAASANAEAVSRLLDRQASLESENAELLAAERMKRERFYDYRAQAAADKLAATQAIVARLQESPEDADRKILPVWLKNLQTAEAMVNIVEHERTTRLADLEGRDLVSAQHELISASYVSIEPDPRALLDEVRSRLPEAMYRQFHRLALEATEEDVEVLLPKVLERKGMLAALRTKHAFDAESAIALADALHAALKDAEKMGATERKLLCGAAKYFLIVDDAQHDLKDPNGFDDDVTVASIVFDAIGWTESIPLAAAPSPA